MPAPLDYDYAIVRVVPRVERDEFMNVGVIVSCEAREVLTARIELDIECLAALAPDVDVACVERHLASIPAICAGGAGAGPLGALPRRARFHWLTAVRSSIIQTSPVHMGFTDDVDVTLERLLQRMVRRRR
ncbi:MAG: DUF3037 domain-containing protein [Planctomycetota bacterium]